MSDSEEESSVFGSSYVISVDSSDPMSGSFGGASRISEASDATEATNVTNVTAGTDTSSIRDAPELEGMEWERAMTPPRRVSPNMETPGGMPRPRRMDWGRFSQFSQSLSQSLIEESPRDEFLVFWNELFEEQLRLTQLESEGELVGEDLSDLQFLLGITAPRFQGLIDILHDETGDISGDIFDAIKSSLIKFGDFDYWFFVLANMSREYILSKVKTMLTLLYRMGRDPCEDFVSQWFGEESDESVDLEMSGISQVLVTPPGSPIRSPGIPGSPRSAWTESNEESKVEGPLIESKTLCEGDIDETGEPVPPPPSTQYLGFRIPDSPSDGPGGDYGDCEDEDDEDLDDGGPLTPRQLEEDSYENTNLIRLRF